MRPYTIRLITTTIAATIAKHILMRTHRAQYGGECHVCVLLILVRVRRAKIFFETSIDKQLRPFSVDKLLN